MGDALQVLAYVFILLACLMGRIVWMRFFLTLAAITGLFFFREGPVFIVLLAAIAINLFYLLYNGIIAKSRELKTPEEEELYKTIFHNFTIPQFKKILKAGRIEHVDPGELLTEEGKPVPHLILIFRGKARVVAGGHTVAYCHPGNLIGEISFLTGSPASATVYVVEPTNYIKWSQDSLKRLLESDKDLNQSMQGIFNTDFLRKYKSKDSNEADEGKD